jgi:hypothetical protein
MAALSEYIDLLAISALAASRSRVAPLIIFR